MKSALYLVHKFINLVHIVCSLFIKIEKILKINKVNSAFVTYQPLDLIVIKPNSLSFSFLVADTQRLGVWSVMESWKETLNSTDVGWCCTKK